MLRKRNCQRSCIQFWRPIGKGAAVAWWGVYQRPVMDSGCGVHCKLSLNQFLDKLPGSGASPSFIPMFPCQQICNGKHPQLWSSCATNWSTFKSTVSRRVEGRHIETMFWKSSTWTSSADSGWDDKLLSVERGHLGLWEGLHVLDHRIHFAFTQPHRWLYNCKFLRATAHGGGPHLSTTVASRKGRVAKAKEVVAEDGGLLEVMHSKDVVVVARAKAEETKAKARANRKARAKASTTMVESPRASRMGSSWMLNSADCALNMVIWAVTARTAWWIRSPMLDQDNKNLSMGNLNNISMFQLEVHNPECHLNQVMLVRLQQVPLFVAFSTSLWDFLLWVQTLHLRFEWFPMRPNFLTSATSLSWIVVQMYHLCLFVLVSKLMVQLMGWWCWSSPERLPRQCIESFRCKGC